MRYCFTIFVHCKQRGAEHTRAEPDLADLIDGSHGTDYLDFLSDDRATWQPAWEAEIGTTVQNNYETVTKNYVVDYLSLAFRDILVTEDGGFTQRYVYAPNGTRISAEYDYAAGTERGESGENLRSDIAVNVIGKVWFRTSMLGSTLFAVDANGETVSHTIYDPWGAPLTETYIDANFSGLDNANNFTGYTYDETLDLYYAQNRFYDADTHRFTQEDIIKDGANWYVYCGNNPGVHTDPWGLGSVTVNGIQITNGYVYQDSYGDWWGPVRLFEEALRTGNTKFENSRFEFVRTLGTNYGKEEVRGEWSSEFNILTWVLGKPATLEAQATSTAPWIRFIFDNKNTISSNRYQVYANIYDIREGGSGERFNKYFEQPVCEFLYNDVTTRDTTIVNYSALQRFINANFNQSLSEIIGDDVGSPPYNFTEEEIGWLAALIFYEARGFRSTYAKELVAQVAVNRVNSTNYDFRNVNTLEAVLKQPRQYGYGVSGTTGTLIFNNSWINHGEYNANKDACYAAAKKVANGTSVDESGVPWPSNVLFQHSFSPNALGTGSFRTYTDGGYTLYFNYG